MKRILALISAAAIVAVVGFAFLILSDLVHADEFLDDGMFSLQEVKASYIGLLYGIDPLIPDQHVSSRYNLNVNADVLTYGFWNSQIQSATDNAQFREVGLLMNIGVRVTDYLDISLYHHSEHVLDSPYVLPGGFPTESGVEVDIYLFSKNRKNKGAF
jgi:hypothetical protein